MGISREILATGLQILGNFPRCTGEIVLYYIHRLVWININFKMKITYIYIYLSIFIYLGHFKNTSYLLVKIAHRFLLENSQNYVVPRGGRLWSYPLVSYASPRGSVAMAISQRAHCWFLAHAAKTHLFGLECFAIDIPFSLSLSPFHLYPIAL